MCLKSHARSLLLPFLVGLTQTHSAQTTAPCGGTSVGIFGLPGLPGYTLQASALSEGGHITGFGSTPGFTSLQAFLFSGGITTGLGTLGGTVSQGVAVNSSGAVVGAATLSPIGFAQHAFLATNGVMLDLGTLGGDFSFAYAINEAGRVAGESSPANGASTVAFLYANGVMTNLGTLGGSFSAGYAINQSGQVAGDSTIADDFESHAFLYTNGGLSDLGTLGGFYSSAFDLNDGGVVVGESALPNFNTHGFVFANGVMQDVGTFGGTFSSAVAVNNSAQVIGIATTPNDEATHGFVFADGQLTDLGTLGGNYVEPFAINHRGQIVGLATLANGARRAFLWEAGTLTDLNSLLPAGSGWELELGQFINDAGRIVGLGKLAGLPQVFVLVLASGGNNQAPVAAAGNDQSAECGTLVWLDGSQSFDPDQDSLAYEWSLGGNVLSTNASFSVLPTPGSHTFTLKVSDPCGESALDEVMISVADTTAPSLVSLPTSASATITANCLATVPDITGSVVATDGCTPANLLVIGQNPAPGTPVAAGLHTIAVTVADAANNRSTGTVPLAVVDNTAPVLTSAVITPAVLFPPNNQTVAVTLNAGASDDCDPAPVTRIDSVTCNESVAPGDIEITSASTANLAARKGTAGNTRVYTLHFTTVDTSGNQALGSVTVTVPPNNAGGRGQGKP